MGGAFVTRSLLQGLVGRISSYTPGQHAWPGSQASGTSYGAAFDCLLVCDSIRRCPSVSYRVSRRAALQASAIAVCAGLAYSQSSQQGRDRTSAVPHLLRLCHVQATTLCACTFQKIICAFPSVSQSWLSPDLAATVACPSAL